MVALLDAFGIKRAGVVVTMSAVPSCSLSHDHHLTVLSVVLL